MRENVKKMAGEKKMKLLSALSLFFDFEAPFVVKKIIEERNF